MYNAPHYVRFLRAIALASGFAGASCAAAVAPDDVIASDSTGVDIAVPPHDVTTGSDAVDATPACPSASPVALNFGETQRDGGPCLGSPQLCFYSSDLCNAQCACVPVDGSVVSHWNCNVECHARGPLPPPDLAA